MANDAKAGWPMAGWPMAPWLEMLGGRQSGLLGGDVTQRFEFAPFLSVNGQGDPALERAIVQDVATYGAQIGQISEIVLALAEGRDAAGLEALAKLREMVAAIEAKKVEFGKTALDRALKAAEELRAHDKNGYQLLLKTLESRG